MTLVLIEEKVGNVSSIFSIFVDSITTTVDSSRGHIDVSSPHGIVVPAVGTGNIFTE